MKLAASIVSATALVLGMAAGNAWSAEAAGKTTLDNLQAAYQGESNAKARYEAFAAKADEEGYKAIATLFRAASASENVHATKHAAAIKKMGGEPKAVIEKPEVKSTKENLEAAIKGETAEKETMYPAFIKQAEAEKNAGAARSFKGALAAEAAHAQLYKQALDNMETWKVGDKMFMVCEVCGFTTMDQNLKKCPVCEAPRSKFLTFK